MICDVGVEAIVPFDLTGVMADTACPVHEALAQVRGAMARTCGREVFCREGTRQVATILTDITLGKGRSGDLEMLEDLCSVMADNASCTMTGTAAARTRDLLRDRAPEWELHVRRQRCTSLTCTMSFTVYVAPDACTGCEACLAVCPESAIVGGAGLVHVISTDACTSCLACLPVCPVGAIRKAGPVKPRLPDSPVPVGSWAGNGTGDAAGGMTRRRRRGE
ncbi:MAG: 4Fe-4S binding protein [Cellulomonadaceae bacterium]|nr:4Fe-4S binding protein [Cellulomonadaceae bacterium]